MRIIATDWYERPGIDDVVVADNIADERYGHTMLNALSTRHGGGTYTFKLQGDNEPIRRGDTGERVSKLVRIACELFATRDVVPLFEVDPDHPTEFFIVFRVTVASFESFKDVRDAEAAFYFRRMGILPGTPIRLNIALKDVSSNPGIVGAAP